MAVLNQICASWSDIEAELADFRAELSDIENSVNTSVNAVLNSPDNAALNAQADAALDAANGFFSTQSIGSLDNALVDSGIATPAGSGDFVLEGLGYLHANNRYWFCNSTNNQTHTQVSSPYGYIGVGAGYYDTNKISGILERTYRDPTTTELDAMLQTASVSTAMAVNTQDQSVTGSRNGSGNIATLREFYRSCSSDMAILSEFIRDSHTRRFGVVWSTAIVDPIYRPRDLDASAFTSTWLRAQVGVVVFDDDMLFSGDVCYFRHEVYLGHNISRLGAQSALELLANTREQDPKSMALISRTLDFNTNEDLRNNSPVIMSSGCKANELSYQKYVLGLAVNDIYRAIDVTGDEGLNVIRNQYSVNDVVDSINEVFGDLVDCGSVGNEFFIKLKDGFGSSGSLTLFYTGDNDCYEQLGLKNAVQLSVDSRSDLGTNIVAPDLKLAREIRYYGGANTTSQVPGSFELMYLGSNSLLPEQTRCLLTQADYWSSIQDPIATIKNVLVGACAGGLSQIQSHASVIADLESYMCFYSARDFRYRDFLFIQQALGSDLHSILVNKLEIYGVDVYVSKSSVRNALTSTLTTLLGQDGLLGTTGPWIKTSLPLSLNYALSARTRLLYAIATQYAYVDEAVAVSAYQELCAYVNSLGVATNSMIAKTSDSSTFSKILDGMDALTGAINDFSDADMNRVIWNIMKTTPGISELFNAQAYTQSKLDAVASGLDSGIDSGVRAIESVASDIMSALGLNALDRKTILVLMQIQASLTTAQAVVDRVLALYNTTTKKIVTLSNFNLNFSGSLGFQSKYLSCYATGNISAMPLMFLAKMLGILNDIADSLNKWLQSLRDIAQFAIDRILCLLDKLVLSLTGTMTYESTMQVGIVTMSFQCTSFVSLGSEFNPDVLQHIMEIRRQIDFLLASLKIQVITFKKHEENMDATKSAFAGSLNDTVNDLLGKLRKCF